MLTSLFSRTFGMGGIAGHRLSLARWWPRLASALALCLALASCKCPDTDTESATSELRGAVVILLDTLRADHVSCYGYHRPTSAHIDALAERGVRFAQVVAPSPWTAPSIGAMLMAEYPQRGFAQSGKLSYSVVETLQRAGIATAAITEGGWVSAAFGMDRGFSHFVEEEGAVQLLGPGERRNPNARGGIEDTFALARQWLVEHKDERFFLFIHTYEPHTPYTRRDFAKTMPPGVVGPTLPIEFLSSLITEQVVLNDSEVDYVKALYDGGILHADRHVGLFMSFLETMGLKDRTLVLVTSDHGEELNDHYPAYTADHGHSLRDPLLMVPLVLYHPMYTYTVREVSAQVRLIDVMPTVAELLGVKVSRPLDGESLVPLMTGEETADRLAIAAHTKRGPPRRCIRYQGYKYIVISGHDTMRYPLKPPPPARQLYDLMADPLEKMNLVATKASLARFMAEALDKAYASFNKPADFTTPDVADPAVLERLKSLGYVSD